MAKLDDKKRKINTTYNEVKEASNIEISESETTLIYYQNKIDKIHELNISVTVGKIIVKQIFDALLMTHPINQIQIENYPVEYYISTIEQNLIELHEISEISCFYQQPITNDPRKAVTFILTRIGEAIQYLNQIDETMKIIFMY